VLDEGAGNDNLGRNPDTVENAGENRSGAIERLPFVGTRGSGSGGGSAKGLEVSRIRRNGSCTVSGRSGYKSSTGSSKCSINDRTGSHELGSCIVSHARKVEEVTKHTISVAGGGQGLGERNVHVAVRLLVVDHDVCQGAQKGVRHVHGAQSSAVQRDSQV
jgi:hypothetical protein